MTRNNKKNLEAVNEILVMKDVLTSMKWYKLNSGWRVSSTFYLILNQFHWCSSDFQTKTKRACFWSPIRSSTIDHRRSNSVQARTKFNRLLAMVDDLNGDQKQALSAYCLVGLPQWRETLKKYKCQNSNRIPNSELLPLGPVSDRHLGRRPLLIDDWIWCGLAPNSIVDDRWSMIHYDSKWQ